MKTNDLLCWSTIILLLVPALWLIQIKKTTQHFNDYVEILPDEISYSNLNKEPPRTRKIFNAKMFYYDQDALALPRYHHRKGEDVYYKDDDAYYTPGKTYSDIAKPQIKFLTPIRLENLDHKIYLKTHSRQELEAYLAELEKEAYHMVLFDQEPKFVTIEGNKTLINQKYPLPYYDSTKYHRALLVQELAQKIRQIKEELGYKDTSIELYVAYKNNTFPQNSDDFINHFNESYAVMSKKKFRVEAINGNFSQYEDIYNVRKSHLFKKPLEHQQDHQLGMLASLKMGYPNQILDYLAKTNKIQEVKEKETPIRADQQEISTSNAQRIEAPQEKEDDRPNQATLQDEKEDDENEDSDN